MTRTAETTARALADAERRLAAAGCDSPRVDAELLVAHVLGAARSSLRADPRRGLSRSDLDELEELVARRVRREPLAYVLGEWGSRQLALKVDKLLPPAGGPALVALLRQRIASPERDRTSEGLCAM